MPAGLSPDSVTSPCSLGSVYASWLPFLCMAPYPEEPFCVWPSVFGLSPPSDTPVSLNFSLVLKWLAFFFMPGLFSCPWPCEFVGLGPPLCFSSFFSICSPLSPPLGPSLSSPHQCLSSPWAPVPRTAWAGRWHGVVGGGGPGGGPFIQCSLLFSSAFSSQGPHPRPIRSPPPLLPSLLAPCLPPSLPPARPPPCLPPSISPLHRHHHHHPPRSRTQRGRAGGGLGGEKERWWQR